MVENFNKQEADHLPVGLIAQLVNSGLPRNNSSKRSERDLNPGPPDFKSCAQTHSTMLPPLWTNDSVTHVQLGM